MGLTFDMRGAQKAQPFGHPLDGRVRQPVSLGTARFHTSVSSFWAFAAVIFAISPSPIPALRR
jgi:hypothetical protein